MPLLIQRSKSCLQNVLALVRPRREDGRMNQARTHFQTLIAGYKAEGFSEASATHAARLDVLEDAHNAERAGNKAWARKLLAVVYPA